MDREPVSPDISVIVPAFNAAMTIESAVESALSQVGPSIEVIVVDDASTDGTAEVALRLADRDKRVRVISKASNGGVSNARNTAIQAATGEWVTPLDADDSYCAGRLSYLSEFANANEADIVADNLLCCDVGTNSQYRMFDEELDGRPQCVDLEVFMALSDLGRSDCSIGYTKPLIRRSFLRSHSLSYSSDIHCAEDWFLYFQCILNGAKFWMLPEAYYRYAVDLHSLSRQRARMVLNVENRLQMMSRAEVFARKFEEDAIAKIIRNQGVQIRRLLWRQRVKKALLDLPFGDALNQWRKQVLGLGK